MGVRLDDLANSTTPTLATVPTQISTADAQNMGTSAPIYYTEPKPPEPNILQRGAEDIEKPFIQLQHTVGAGMSFLGDNIKAATPFGDLGSRITRAGIIMQERSIRSMQKKFSNFTPNKLDDLIGMVPTLAGYFGLAAASTTAIATGALATTFGIGLAAEEFNKMKAQGHGTGMSDLAGSLEGVAGGAVMALGFNKVSEFVEPWFTNVLGATVAKMVGVRTALLAARAAGNAAAGAVGMGAQAATTDTGEMITGVEKADAVKVMTDTVHSGIMGFVLGGGLGTTFALHQMAKFRKDLIDLGFNPKEAHQNSVMVFGQGGHLLTDAVEKNLKYKADELARVQSPAAKGEVSPDILERGGIPDELNFPSVVILPCENQEASEITQENKYVKLTPLNLMSKLSDKATGEDIRYKFVGARNEQWGRGAHLGQDGHKMMPTELEDTAFFHSDVGQKFGQLVLQEGTEVYHGTSKEGRASIESEGFKVTEGGMNEGSGVSLTTKPEVASVFGEGRGGGVVKRFLDWDTKLVDRNEFLELRNSIAEDLMKGARKRGESVEDVYTKAKLQAIEQFKKQGYDGADLSSSPEGLKEIRLWNVEKLRQTANEASGVRKAAEKAMQDLYDLHGVTDRSPSEEEIAKAEVLIRAMKPIWEKVVNPTSGMLAWKKESGIYYDEAGEVSKAFGTIDEIRDNYHSARLYRSNPLSPYKGLASVLKRFSAHGLMRYYPNSLLAMLDGKEFQTTSAVDNLVAHNQEMTAVNYGRQMMNAMSETKGAILGSWVKEKALPEDWEQVGTASKVSYQKDEQGELEKDENGNPIAIKQIFAAPKGIAYALKALTDPNYMRNIPGWKTASTINGIAKTGLLSFAFFHHLSIGGVTVASLNGAKTLGDMPGVLKNDLMSEAGFRAMELEFLRAGGETSIIHTVQDIIQGHGDDTLDLHELLKAPVAKQLAALSKANTRLLFDGMQRYSKVTTWGQNVAKWEGEHPDATPEEIELARRGYANATNAVEGGLNWEALGVTRTVQSLARFFMLAPDWVVSAFMLGKYAVTDWKGTAGSQARWTSASAILGGFMLANAWNYMRTGHSTLDNKPGHWMDAEVSPDVYASFIRGGAGEFIKLASDLAEETGLGGGFRYLEGKLSPLLSAATTALTGREMSGGDIWRGDNPLMKNINGFWHIFAHTTPAPMGATNAVDYFQREPAEDRTALGWGGILTGTLRFSKPGSRRR